MLPILYRDDHLVILDKPAGLASHPGPAGGASVEDAFPTLSRRRAGPWLVHRLDRDTAGCLVVALRRAALQQAQACFADGRVDRRYWAVVSPGPAAEDGLIDRPLLKRTDPSGWRVVLHPTGQPARTAWRVLGRGDGMAWLELVPQTGRTHQLRVHCAAIGCPILGDARYGGAGGDFHLLARSIALPLDPAVAATAPVPAHMQAALAACGAGATSTA